MKKYHIGVVVVVFALSVLLQNCGSSSSSNNTEASLPSVAYVNYSPLNPTSTSQSVSKNGSSVSKVITIDNDNPAMGEQQSWMLAATKLSASYITSFLEGLVVQSSIGASLLKSLSSEMASYVGKAQTGVMGPTTVNGVSVYVGISFVAFTGCASGGVYTATPTESSPLSMTVFIGSNTTNVLTNPVFAACVTNLATNATAGTVWLKQMNYVAAIAGSSVPASTKFLVNSTWNDSTTSGCPFTACRKFTVKIYDPDGEYADSSNHAPQLANGEVYIDTSNANLMYLNYAEQMAAATEFVTTGATANLTCNRYNGTLFNVFTNGTEVAGKFVTYYNNELPTVANGGITEEGLCGTVSDGSTLGQSEQAIIASFAIGACHSATQLVEAAQCPLASIYTLSTTDASTSRASDATTYPANAPTSLSSSNTTASFGACTTDQDCHTWSANVATETAATLGPTQTINVQNPVCRAFLNGTYCTRECVGNDIMQGICPVVQQAYNWGGVSGDVPCTTVTGGDTTSSCPTGQSCYCTHSSWY